MDTTEDDFSYSYPDINATIDDLIDIVEPDDSVHIADGDLQQLQCKSCGSVEFVVLLNEYVTAVRCNKCKYEVAIAIQEV